MRLTLQRAVQRGTHQHAAGHCAGGRPMEGQPGPPCPAAARLHAASQTPCQHHAGEPLLGLAGSPCRHMAEPSAYSAWLLQRPRSAGAHNGAATACTALLPTSLLVHPLLPLALLPAAQGGATSTVAHRPPKQSLCPLSAASSPPLPAAAHRFRGAGSSAISSSRLGGSGGGLGSAGGEGGNGDRSTANHNALSATACVRAHMCASARACVHVRLRTCMRACWHTCVHFCACTCMHVCRHASVRAAAMAGRALHVYARCFERSGGT